MSRSSGGVSIGAALVVALVAICLILGIVGLTFDEFTYYGNDDNKISTSFESYSDTVKSLHDNEIEDDSLMSPMVAFAYLSVVASALVFVLAILGLFFRGRFFSIIIGIVGVLTIVVGVVFLVLCLKFCEEGSVSKHIVGDVKEPDGRRRYSAFGRRARRRGFRSVKTVCKVIT